MQKKFMLRVYSEYIRKSEAIFERMKEKIQTLLQIRTGSEDIRPVPIKDRSPDSASPITLQTLKCDLGPRRCQGDNNSFLYFCTEEIIMR